MSYEADVTLASRLMPVVKEGFAASLTEAATRFAISHPAIGTILVGMATRQQFEAALAAVQKGPLPPAALERLTAAAGIRRRAKVITEFADNLSEVSAWALHVTARVPKSRARRDASLVISHSAP
jgi:hypothetical protein